MTKLEVEIKERKHFTFKKTTGSKPRYLENEVFQKYFKKRKTNQFIK